MINQKYSENDIYISFETTRQCNMSCDYCYNKHVLTTKPDDNILIYKFFIYKLKKILLENKDLNFELDILGGEPSIAPLTVEYINTVNDFKCNNVKFISLTTNGLVFLKDYKKIKNINNIKIEITYHNFVDIIKFKKNILLYNKIFNYVIVTINLYPIGYNEAEIIDLIEFCKLHNINTVPITVYKDNHIIKVDNSNIIYELTNIGNSEFINELSANDIQKYSLMETTKNFKCKLRSFNILFDGTISTSCGHQLEKLNITKNNIPLFEYVKCNGDLCEGSAGLMQKYLTIKENNEKSGNKI